MGFRTLIRSTKEELRRAFAGCEDIDEAFQHETDERAVCQLENPFR